MFRDIANVLQEQERKISWKQIGELTKSGHPRHPLYARYDFGLKNFDIDSYLYKIHISIIPRNCMKQILGLIAISSNASLALFVLA